MGDPSKINKGGSGALKKFFLCLNEYCGTTPFTYYSFEKYMTH